MRLAARVGFGAIKFHDRTVHSLQVPRLELDEAWSFVAKKQRRVKPGDGPFVGDQYVFLAASGSSKAIVSFQVGKRNEENPKAFIWDLRERIINAPEISTDAFASYAVLNWATTIASCPYERQNLYWARQCGEIRPLSLVVIAARVPQLSSEPASAGVMTA